MTNRCVSLDFIGVYMDLRVRKYVLYRVRKKENDRKYLIKLKQYRDQMKQDIIDESPDYMDGQPRGKGKTGDVTQRKALRLVDVDRRIERIEKELAAIQNVEDKINNMWSYDRKGKRVNLALDMYNETIKKECTDLTAKAQLMNIGRRQLIQGRARLLEMFAVELGEYINIEEFK